MSTVGRIFALVLVISRLAISAEPPVADNVLPRIAPTEADKAAATIHLHNGLRLELVASEPQVSSPVGICFDEDGRLFVVEMLGYPDLREQRPGRIKLLESTRGDGHYDKATIYADNLLWPTGIMPYDGGVLVTASPDIIYLKDSKHNGISDQRKVLFSGFGPTNAPLNVQGLVNGLTWGPDNRIWGTTSENGGQVVRPDSGDKPLDLHNRDFSFDPRKLDLRAENGGGQHGLSFDPFGRRYVSYNSKPIQTFMYDAQYAGRNPLYAMPPALQNILADGMDVFRISPEEAWRVLRTQWRVAGAVSGPVEGGGRASGYFTSASGITIYTGDALPPEYSGNAFIAEPAGNLVDRQVISTNGPQVISHRAADEKNAEFLASTDIWFRPVQLANGPDGALYIVDMYREVIEHPWSLPDSIKGRLDLHSGTERGRIWRVVREGFVPRKTPNLSKATTDELVKLLAHPNGWHRETAARLLYERRDPAAVAALQEMSLHSTSAFGRIGALRALAASVIPAREFSRILLHALSDNDPHVRLAAIRISEPYLADDSTLWERARLLVDDADSAVRFQLALSLGEAQGRDVAVPLGQILRRDVSDPWIRAAVLSSSSGIESSLFTQLWNVGGFREGQAGGQTLRQFADLVGAGGREPQITEVARKIDAIGASADESRFLLARALREGIARGSARQTMANTLQDTLEAARTVAANASANESTRIQAIGLLGTGDFAFARPALLGCLAPTEPQPIQSAALAAIDRFRDADVGKELVQRLQGFSPRLRGEALGALIKRPERALILLNAIDGKTLRATDIPSPQTNLLRRHSDPRVRALATKVLAAATSTRQQVIDRFMPALQLQGLADRGRAVYQQRCVSCHRIENQGFAVGPDLSTVRGAGKEKTLINILDPNREVAPNYIAYLAETINGDSILGIISSETSNDLTIRQAFGKETTILRSDLKRLQSQRLSLMPEGVEEGLSPQDLADLLEFIMTAGALRGRP